MTLTEIIVDIQRREAGVAVAPEVERELKELAEEFGVDKEPTWLRSIFEAVQQGRTVSPPVFFEWTGSDPYSYVGEIAALLNWQYDNQGEYEVLDFPATGRRVFIGHEAHSPTGHGGSSYEITALAAPT